LREVNEELEENHLMTERELREEMEFKESLIREQMKRIQTAEETNLDYESTIMRFRELVLSLQRYGFTCMVLMAVMWRRYDKNDRAQRRKPKI
jgi:hypothetical protein